MNNSEQIKFPMRVIKRIGGELFPVRLCIAVSFADLINVLICIKYVRLNMKHAEKSSPSEL